MPAFQLDELTLEIVRSQMATGVLTARTLAEAYLERIDQIDRSGPTLRSVIEVNPDAMEIADRLDRERAEGHAYVLADMWRALVQQAARAYEQLAEEHHTKAARLKRTNSICRRSQWDAARKTFA